ncbi:MAG TPA: putative baseplate assembly protein [Nitrosomonas sp.]|nr:putative baseplate assembly protein [Nitrosomonas sp.]HMW21401.1 putative baseplate assembly protein [Nitrosomonas sp.]HMW69272.1 putative baseplate assembly protein [Nitrosomonas sp.]HMY62353.1 putative baseplate assembly protein [Nitrosomonas sp.]HMY90920.1 putative baseplate assembly protein [Nitrosomonas sp.]
MLSKAPLIDTRSTAEIARQIRQLLNIYLRNAPYNWESADGGEIGRALTEISAYYCGLIVDRINRAPENNLLAFLDLLGNSLVLPVPAQVPVTFFLDTRATEGLNLPAGTRMLAEPERNSNDPVPFETSRDLWLTTLELTKLENEPDSKEYSNLIKNRPNLTKNLPETPLAIFKAKTDSYIFEFTLPAESKLPVNHPVTLFFFIGNPVYDPALPKENSDSIQPLIWEYSSSEDRTEWKSLLVEDETQSLTRTGSVEFLVPSDFSKPEGKQTFPIRVRLKNDAPYNPPPSLQWVALNTVNAEQVISVREEILGSGNDNPNQTFSTFRKPVLVGQQLQVLERAAAANSLTNEQSPQDNWVDWKEVTDFYQSSGKDRHYMLDRITGKVRFGDGNNGMIPPPGVRNIRLQYYRSGGGSNGNVPAGSIKSLVTSINKIEKIANFIAASGGADKETYESLLDRAPKILRHRDRIVTVEDYEDHAKLASPEVARALCVPLIDLAVEPSKVITSADDEENGRGKVSVIIVPHTSGTKPLPSQILLSHVENKLREKSLPGITLSVVGPLYLSTKITLSLQLESLRFEDQIKHELLNKLKAYLHPLTGRNGLGWPFGRKPHESDIYKLIGEVPRINYVSGLQIVFKADKPSDCRSHNPVECIEKSERFLICSDDEHVILIEGIGN